MDLVTLLWDYIIPFIFVLTVLVFVHELGHYWIARRNGVRVEVFSIGFGPEVFGWNDKNGTRWKFSAIPMGGYVKMFGEGGEVLDEDGNAIPMPQEDAAVSFAHKRLGQRAAIVFAGPAANFIFAIIVFAGLFAFLPTQIPLAAIGEIQEGSAAEQAGFKSGDTVEAISGREVHYFTELRDIVLVSPGQALTFSILRDGQPMKISVTPRIIGENPPQGRLGVAPDPEKFEVEEIGIAEASLKAVSHSFSIMGQILGAIGEIFTGDRGSEELGGPLRIAQMSGQIAQLGMAQLLSFIAVFSINLCLINLFPIPVLDGGHLVFYAFEALLGRPLGEKAQEYSFRFGLILVLALMVFATFNDLTHFKIFDF